MATGINYSRPTQMTYLACPDPSDSLETVGAKMKAIDRVVTEGKSVAVHVGYLDGYTMDTAEDVEAAIVAREMTAVEELQYTAWKSGTAFPGFDFERFIIDVTRDAAANTRYERLVEAMTIVWNTDKATPGNAAYVSLYMQHLTPLLFAVMKVEKAKKESRWGFPRDPSTMDKVEAETIQKVTDIASRVMNQGLQRVKVSARHIVDSKNTLMARKRALNVTTTNEADDNSTFINTTQSQPQPQQGQPRPLGSRPLPTTPIIDLTKPDTSDAMTQTSFTNKRATQASEANTALPQSKFMKMGLTDEARLGSQKGVGTGSTAATTQAFESTQTIPPQRRYMSSRVNYEPALHADGNTTPALPKTTQTSNVPAMQNYMKPTVSDATESGDEN